MTHSGHAKAAALQAAKLEQSPDSGEIYADQVSVCILYFHGSAGRAARLGLPMIPTYITAVVGNMIPVPILYLFARRVLEWGQDKPLIGKPCTFFMTKGKRGGEKLQATAGRGLFMALLLFVGIPLPGTGAWTGTLAASLLDMDFKSSVLACMGGVLLAGVIMGLASSGVLGVAGAIFAR